MSEEQVLAELRGWADAQGQRFVASACGVSQALICQTVKGRRPVGPQVLRAMGYRRVTSFERVGA